MKKMILALSLIAVLTIALLAGCNEPVKVEGQTVQNTYLGEIEFQDQTLAKASAAKLNREIDLQRASQLTLWAMPITSFYQSHVAAKSNLGYN